ncbi:hypothetical protein K8I31_06995, partial [bacterium]|nr:hypothetical protein [bacterium]
MGEVIVVCGVLSLLFIVSLPNFMNNQIRADLAQAVSDLRMISNAINAYYVDYEDTPPNVKVTKVPPPSIDFD